MDNKTAKDPLEAFNQRLAEVNLRGQWSGTMPSDGPTPRGDPFIWHYAEVLKFAEEACTQLPDSEHARRSLMFCNPSLPRDITHTIGTGIQLIQPNEIAWPHRHAAAALRFVIDGSPDMVTVVDQIEYQMENYDLILTPNWGWHGHHNRSDNKVTWLDILDLPTVLSLNQMFYEPGEIGLIEPDGRARMNTAGEERSLPSQMKFAWADMESQLREAAKNNEIDPFDGATCAYNQSDTGSPTIPTIQCRAHLLKPGYQVQKHRHSSMTVYFVIDGEGETQVGDKILKWSKHDTFNIPNWAWHQHLTDSISNEALLFSVDDSPTLKALDLLRIQTVED